MSVPAYFPYRSLEVRDSYLAQYDAQAARDWPVASEERMVPTSFGQAFVRITGPVGAPPLVLLPGAGSYSLMWRPNVAALSTEYRTYAVDPVGDIGRSTCTRPVESLEDQLTWLSELFDAVAPAERINMAGVSYGGALTAQYALRYPQRLNKAVLIAPGNTVLRVGIRFYLRLIPAVLNGKRFMPQFVRWIFADMERIDPRWVETTIAELTTNMRVLQRKKTPIPPVMSDAEWAAIRVPALFMVGEHEVIYPPAKAVKRLARVAPQIKSVLIPGAGHDLNFAQADLANRTILEFLKQEPAASSPVAGADSQRQLVR